MAIIAEKMGFDINYSIIIPHKNIPHLLQRCLDSIPRREDVQIIVVDDNSDSSEVNFDDFPGLNDPFVEVVFGKNEDGRKGAGYARNLGLEKAKGKWLVFADADDFFMPCFNESLNKYVNDENDIIYFYVTSIDDDTSLPSTRHLYIVEFLEKIKETNEWDLTCFLHNPVGKFIKRKIVCDSDILYSEVQWGNDIFFGIKTMAAATSKKIADETIYCIISREASLTKQISSKTLLIRFMELHRAYILLENLNQKHYLKKIFSELWLKILYCNFSKATLLIPKMINLGRIRFVIFHIAKQLVKNTCSYERTFKKMEQNSHKLL